MNPGGCQEFVGSREGVRLCFFSHSIFGVMYPESSGLAARLTRSSRLRKVAQPLGLFFGAPVQPDHRGR